MIFGHECLNMKIFLKLYLLVFLLSGCSKSKDDYVNNPGASSLHNRAVGASANEILSSGKYSSLKIEVMYMTGYPPDADNKAISPQELAMLQRAFKSG